MSLSNCGCEPGRFLCATAVALWGRVNATYDLYKQTGEAGNWAVYEVARIAYTNHLPQGGNT